MKGLVLKKNCTDDRFQQRERMKNTSLNAKVFEQDDEHSQICEKFVFLKNMRACGLFLMAMMLFAQRVEK